MIQIVVIGAAGRMGCALVRAAAESSEVNLVAAVSSEASSSVGRDVGELAGLSAAGVRVTSDLAVALRQADVALDFSVGTATPSNLAACRHARKPLLIGTTGFPQELADSFAVAGRDIPLLVAPNTSVAVALLLELVRAAARSLPAQFDIEVIDLHHRTKQDAPSGTALALGRAAAEARGQPFDRAGCAGTARNDSTGAGAAMVRQGDIGFASVRAGDIIGEHTVLFAGPGERISLGHQATDRVIFARGALQAAAWLASQPAGHYSMRDVIGYKS